MSEGPRIYNLFPLVVGTIADWTGELARIRVLGFDWVYLNPFHLPGFSGSLYAVKDHHSLHPLFDSGGEPAGQLSAFTAAASGHGLRVMMDLVVNHVSKDALLVSRHPEWFVRDPDGALVSPVAVDPVDPQVVTEWGDLAALDYQDAGARAGLAEYWRDLALRHARMGFAGFRCDAAYQVPAEVWRVIIAGVRAEFPAAHFAAETLGCTPAQIQALAEAGFDSLFNSAKWWDFHQPWLLEQYDTLRAIAPSIAFPESHDTERLAAEVEGRGDTQAWYRLMAAFAAFFSAGWMMPIGYEWGWRRRLDVVASRPEPREPRAFDLSGFIAALNRVKATTPALGAEGPQIRLTPPDDPVVVLLRRGVGDGDAAVLVMNTDWSDPAAVSLGRLLAEQGCDPAGLEECTPEVDANPVPGRLELAPLALRMFRSKGGGAGRSPGEAAAQSGILILDVAPTLDCGRWPVKREVGDTLEVTADILKDGHDRLAARVLWRHVGEAAWQSEPMVHQDNDRWIGRVRLERMGRAEFTVEAWVDAYESWRDDLGKRRGAGQPVAVELEEGRRLLEEALARAQDDDHDRLERALAALDAVTDAEEKADRMVSGLVRAVMARWPDRSRLARHHRAYAVAIDRVAARFSAWYEIMARSQGSQPGRSASFKDCERRLPEIARMGFDVVYLLPIHPIGRVHRKGPDNTLNAAEGDPGSPYAIGSVEGGHTAIHPALGTLDDFRRFVAAAKRHDLEVALDFAVQCAPDHPWVTEHPDWFLWRPDGTIRHAENPPKKYQDIVNLNFHGPHAAELWLALREVVLFWVGEGVRIFRVDNPHTKPVPFWEWLIRTVHRDHPDVLFLAEAFTRPKMMRALAKAGFSQSYTYFTWRNFKGELTDYLTELAQGESRDYMRPHFWPTTPDILPPYLQSGGRAAFRIRLVLAATLSSLYGIYNGYELCEAAAIPGREEYLHSEKYQYKVWDWSRPGHIKDDVARLNAIRRANPALHEFENLRFHPSDDEAVLFYGKSTPDRSNMIFVAVTLDPFDLRAAELTFPLAEMGVPDGETFEVEDLLTGARHLWRGARQRVRLDPEVNPAVLWRVTVWSSVDYRTPCF
ncbi:maltotransferase domain-containing protein [Magnetospirillum sp. UT-4]|uniref:maltotransferase domain-containing protein n=1 Tax=Magnetospirillum sp. UT-4 TaxID=2681467 RepID=UPI001385A4AF|nr:maltotransferase domain-containing protein [Magnetospirillum sp. UT-4]CAA7619863.1 Alpha-1,4-glucan:maltose-1-phosphate maltosyltransferase [Magnetospirillum sp. UT-4]